MPKVGFRHTKKSRRQLSRTRKQGIAAGLIVPWNRGKKGAQVPWNKGLTKESDTRVAKYAVTLLGHPYTKATKRKMSQSARRRMIADPQHMQRIVRARLRKWKREGGCPWKGRQNTWVQGRKNPAFTTKHVRYKHFYYAGQHFRSSWEVAFAKWCRAKGIKYQYEPKTFRLAEGRGRLHTYTPDFYLPVSNAYIEIAGYIPDRKAEKFALFQKQYPDVQWVLLMRPGLEATGVLKRAV